MAQINEQRGHLTSEKGHLYSEWGASAPHAIPQVRHWESASSTKCS